MRFFFYGTLLNGSDNPVAREVHRWLEAEGPATTRGTLYAVPDSAGWYPALLPGDGTVHGELYRAGAAFDATALMRMDAYEEYDPADCVTSLYRREPVDVAGAVGNCTAQAYRFNAALPDNSRLIAGGDFRVWLARENLLPFCDDRSFSLLKVARA